ncbi:MAG: transporter [Caulobacter sp.]|nr:transporter [Caulobacter sp.]
MPPALRLGLYYAAIFVGTGVSLPFMPVWFQAHGMSGAAIGVLMSAPMLVRIVSGPAMAVWADGFTLRRTPMVLLGLGAALAFAAIGVTRGFTPWLIAWLVGSSLLATLAPLADVMTLRAARTGGFTYGWPRGIGSLAFVCGNLIMGAMLSLKVPVDAVIVWISLAALLAAVLARVTLPPQPVHESGERQHRRERWRGLSQLMANRPFLLAVGSAALIQATHAFYYLFSAILWRGQGISDVLIGILWATGVAAETAFMWFLEPWRRRVGPEMLLIIGGVAALIRWSAFAFSPPLWALFPLQALHALSFTATFLGSLPLIERLAPRESASAAQTVSSALSGGLLIGLASIASGPLFDAVGATGYLAMSGLTVVGLVGAVVLYRRERMNPSQRPI